MQHPAIDLIKDYMKEYYDEILHNRALPAVEDGLKPVQRKLLYAFWTQGRTHDKPYTKSAIAAGEVLKYNPHSDSAAYDAAVNMSCYMNNVPLLDLHGGNKTIYGTSAAAHRYTELRTSKFSDEVLLDKLDPRYNSVNFVPNFDQSLQEPEFLPSKLPVCLLNGVLGLGGGFMCSMLPHSINTICDKTIQYIDNPDIDLDEFTKDFLPSIPTGGIIINKSGIINSYKIPASIENVSNGVCISRAKIRYDDKKNTLHIFEVPYYMTTDKLTEGIKKAIKEEIIPEISSIKDLSAKGKVDIEIKLKRGTDENAVIGKLYKFGNCQNSVPIVNIMTHQGVTKIYENIKDIISDWLEFRIITIKRIHNKVIKDLNYKLHIKEGVDIICSNSKNIDYVIKIIKDSKLTEKEIYEEIKNKFNLSNIQTEYVVKTELIKLAKVNINALKDEIKDLKSKIDDEIESLKTENIIKSIKADLREIKKNYGNKIYNDNDFTTEFLDLNLDPKAMIETRIPDENYIFILSKFGFLKKIKIDKNVKSQSRRGAGNSLGKFKEEDAPIYNFISNSKDNIFFFTEDGYSYRYKCYTLPNSDNINSYGKTINHLVENKRIVSILALSDEELNDDNLAYFTLTKNGKIKATMVSELNSSYNKLIAAKINETDSLEYVTKYNILDITDETILITNKSGFVIRSNIENIPLAKRVAMGNNSFKPDSMKRGREILSCNIVNESNNLIFIYSNGLAKRCVLEDFPVKSLNTIGVMTGTREDAELVNVIPYENENDVLNIISNKKSVTVRISDIPFVKRVAFGSILKKLDEDEHVVNAIIMDGSDIEKKEANEGLKKYFEENKNKKTNTKNKKKKK